MSQRDDDIIICRCEDVTLGDIRAALRAGITDFEELKRVLRVTMGPCQGRTCRQLVVREISDYLGVSPEEIPVPTYRQPTSPVKLKELAEAFDKRTAEEDGDPGEVKEGD